MTSLIFMGNCMIKKPCPYKQKEQKSMFDEILQLAISKFGVGGWNNKS
jgi:hypothetical protein